MLSSFRWLLYCMTFPDADLLAMRDVSEVRSWHDVVLRVPLDCVDLQLVAQLFDVQITVSRWDGPSWRFEPPCLSVDTYGVHLLWQRSGSKSKSDGLWAALLGLNDADSEARCHIGRIVRLGELPGSLSVLSKSSALVVDYSHAHGCYCLVGRNYDRFLVEGRFFDRFEYCGRELLDLGARPKSGCGMFWFGLLCLIVYEHRYRNPCLGILAGFRT